MRRLIYFVSLFSGLCNLSMVLHLYCIKHNFQMMNFMYDLFLLDLKKNLLSPLPFWRVVVVHSRSFVFPGPGFLLHWLPQNASTRAYKSFEISRFSVDQLLQFFNIAYRHNYIFLMSSKEGMFVILLDRRNTSLVPLIFKSSNGKQ